MILSNDVIYVCYISQGNKQVFKKTTLKNHNFFQLDLCTDF